MLNLTSQVPDLRLWVQLVRWQQGQQLCLTPITITSLPRPNHKILGVLCYTQMKSALFAVGLPSFSLLRKESREIVFSKWASSGWGECAGDSNSVSLLSCKSWNPTNKEAYWHSRENPESFVGSKGCPHLRAWHSLYAQSSKSQQGNSRQLGTKINNRRITLILSKSRNSAKLSLWLSRG